MEDALYYRCSGCGYEFLARTESPACPRCKNRKLEKKDMEALGGFDE